MITTRETVIEKIAVAEGAGESLRELTGQALDSLGDVGEVGGVIAATFSNEMRFPSLAIWAANRLGLSSSTMAFDLQMACSAYPYAVYLAGKMSADTGKKVIVIDGDVQSRLVNKLDHATGNIFSDAVTASVVSVNPNEISKWDFLSRLDDVALKCGEAGPIEMDGMKVFSFVATEVNKWLREFITKAGMGIDAFAPHQANPYMVRQLARSLGFENRLLTIGEEKKNPGSCSVAMALAGLQQNSRVLIAGFGAGYSASAGIVRVRL